MPLQLASPDQAKRETSISIEVPYDQGALDRDMAGWRPDRMRPVCSRSDTMIRVDAIWLAIEPLDMRARTETALARVVAVINGAVFLWRSASVTFAGAA